MPCPLARPSPAQDDPLTSRAAASEQGLVVVFEVVGVVAQRRTTGGQDETSVDAAGLARPNCGTEPTLPVKQVPPGSV